MIDGAKALASAVDAVFGDRAVVQRCQIHKRRNVIEHLPLAERDQLDARLKAIFADGDPETGRRRALRLAKQLEAKWPDAAGSLREGLEHMFTIASLGIEGRLGASLRTTNMIESMISTIRRTTSNVKRWQDKSDMRRRWCAAGLIEAETRFRRVNGYQDLPHLKTAVTRQTQTVTPPQPQ